MNAQEILTVIPKLEEADIAFPAGHNITHTFKVLTPVALEWENHESRQHWALNKFSELFFKGGTMPEPNRELFEEADLVKVATWIKAGMGSFYPKHEHKEAVCAMLWDVFFLEPE